MSSKRILVITMASIVSLGASLGMAADGAKSSKPSAKPPAAKPTAKKPTADAAEAKAEKVPRLTVIEPVKDFGTVPRGEKLDWSFVIKNTGTTDLQVLAARPGCGCTVADFDKVIKPGETGKVNAHVDTTNFAGPIAKMVTVETNDPNTPTSTLTINAVVKPYVEAFPGGLTRFTMLQGDTDTQSLTIYSEEEEPFEITKVEAPKEWMKAAFRKIEKPEDLAPGVGKPGQTQYKLDITVGGPDAPIGPIAEKVRIVTNSKHQPEYLVSISGLIRPTLRIEPTNVNFGSVTPSDTAATRSVILHTNDQKTPDRFQVTKAESSVSSITAEIKPGQKTGDFEVTLQVAKDAKPGEVDGTVKIYTTDKINPVVTVPVKGTIKSATAAAGTN